MTEFSKSFPSVRFIFSQASFEIIAVVIAEVGAVVVVAAVARTETLTTVHQAASAATTRVLGIKMCLIMYTTSISIRRFSEIVHVKTNVMVSCGTVINF
jgi:hypothetical protein